MTRTGFLLAPPALVLAALAVVPAPALAQQTDRVLIIYGDDKCPESEGQDIVVCARKPEGERYRIPEELRHSLGPPNWRDKAKSLEYVGRSGTQSCSAAGTGGWTGCWSSLMSQARAERKEDRDAATAAP